MLMPGAPLMAPPGLDPMMGAPPAGMMGPQFPSLDPSLLAGALAPAAAMQQADVQSLQAQQDAAMASVLQMMRQMPNPAAQAAMTEPGAVTSPLGLPPAPAGAAPAPDLAGLDPMGGGLPPLPGATPQLGGGY